MTLFLTARVINIHKDAKDSHYVLRMDVEDFGRISAAIKKSVNIDDLLFVERAYFRMVYNHDREYRYIGL